MIPIDPATLANAAKGAITVLGPVAFKKMVKYQKGNHGSKVKIGNYQECEIAMFGDKACIVVNPDGGEIVLLTSDYIKSCRFIKKKFRKLKMKDYYYYEIVFIDGKQSYVRMSKKYRDALKSYTTIQKT